MAIKKKRGNAAKKVKKVISKNKVSVKKASPKKKVAKKAAPEKKAVAKKKKLAKKAAPKRKVVAKKKATAAKNKPANPATKEVKKLVSKTLITQVAPPGENMHFIPEIPVHGETTPLTPIQAHEVENTFHNKEEVALHQENKKINDAFAIRKNPKNIYRRGRR